MVAFAVGGLLGDTLLHLVPQTFLGEPHDAKAHFVLNDGNRNAVLGRYLYTYIDVMGGVDLIVWVGLFIFIGFAAFVAMDKTLRIVTGGSGDSHSHSHSHPHPRSSEWGAGAGTGAETSSDSSGLTRRKKGTLKHEEEEEGEEEEKKTGQGVKPSSLLNLISDFTHNITDGLAMSGAFYAGPLVGASTCFAVMLHEIPHEVGDFALLIQGGFTKWQAMGAQFITALGAFTGTLIGIAIQEYSASSSESSASSGGGSATGGVKMGEGIMGTDLRAGDLVLPFTAGTFLYVAFSAVPEILETGTNRRLEAVKAIKQGWALPVPSLLGVRFVCVLTDGGQTGDGYGVCPDVFYFRVTPRTGWLS